MTFEEALAGMKIGENWARPSIDGYVTRVADAETTPEPLPYLRLFTESIQVPWTPSQEDMFATDWALASL